MDILALAAPIISAKITIYVVMGALTVWAILSAILLHVKTEKLARSLRTASSMLNDADTMLTFVDSYEATNARLERHNILGPRWREFRESLVMPRHPGEPIRATTRPEVWFNASLLRGPGVNLDPRYHAALPNMLVGAGLLFTFLGLAVALGSAGGIVAGATEARNGALRTLLDTASFKFLTSLAGIALSIIYALWRKARIHNVEKALDQFQAALQRVIPIVTPVALQQEQLKLMERQSTHLENFSNDLALSIGSAIDQTFNERLAEHVGPLTEAIQRLSDSMSSRNEDAMKGMMDAFLTQLEVGTGDHMKGVAESLSGLGGRLEGLKDSLGDAAVRMSQSADAMAARMGEGAEIALSRITDQMGGLVETLRAVADQTREAGTQASGAMADRITAATKSFEIASDRIAVTLAETAANMQKQMDQQTNESTARLSAQFEAMMGELRGLSETSRTVGHEAFAELARRVSESAATFEKTAGHIAATLEKSALETGGAFGKGAEDTVAQIAAASEGMRDEIRGVLADLRTTMGTANETLRNGTEESAKSLRATLESASSALATSLDHAARRLSEAGGSAGEALQRGGVGASESLVSAGSVFVERASTLASEVSRLAETSRNLADQSISLERATTEAAKPLVSSAVALESAGLAARDAIKPLSETNIAVARAVEQIAGAVQRLEIAATSAGQLTNTLNNAAQRFEGVDRELAKTLSGLQIGLQGFTKQVGEFVAKTDTNLARAATQLANLVKSLEDTLEDFAPHSGQAKGR
jgi:hypothetical protein